MSELVRPSEELNLSETEDESWVDDPFTSGTIMLYREVEGQPVAAATVSYKIAQHPDTPDDFVDKLNDSVKNALQQAIFKAEE